MSPPASKPPEAAGISAAGCPSLGSLLAQAAVAGRQLEPSPLAPAELLEIGAADWGRAAQLAKQGGWRWVAGWGEDEGEHFSVSVCLEQQGRYSVMRGRVASGNPVLPSHAPYYVAADRPERHMQDLFGIRFAGHPDSRRWTRHQAWDEDSFPLRKSFSGIWALFATTSVSLSLITSLAVYASAGCATIKRCSAIAC